MNPLDNYSAKKIFFIDTFKELFQALNNKRRYPVILSKKIVSNPDEWNMLAFDLHCANKIVANA